MPYRIKMISPKGVTFYVGDPVTENKITTELESALVFEKEEAEAEAVAWKAFFKELNLKWSVYKEPIYSHFAEFVVEDDEDE